MSARLVKLLTFTVLIAAIVCYLFYLNPEPVSVKYGPGPERVASGPMAMLLVVVFFLGAVCSSAFSFLLGLRYQIREWRTNKVQKMRTAHYDLILNAREQLASNNFQNARNIFRKIVDKDPGDLVSRIMLAETYHQEGNVTQALKVLDEARSEFPNNKELIFRTAELNLSAGNLTAAADALRLVLSTEPKNRTALEGLVRISSELQKWSEAVEYQNQRVKCAANNTEQENALEKLAELELRLLKETYPKNPSRDNTLYRGALESLLARHRNFAPAFVEIGILEKDLFRLEAANKAFQKAFRFSPEVSTLEEIAKLWLGADQPTPAVANIRNLLREQEKKDTFCVDGEIFFVFLLLSLENIDEAISERERFRGRETKDLSIQQKLSIVDALLLKRNGDSDEGFGLLASVLLNPQGLELPGYHLLEEKQFATDGAHVKWSKAVREHLSSQSQPAPRLLTN